MRIGMAGTQSTGKSTLAKALGKLPQFKDYEIITERSVYLRDQGIALNSDSTLKGQIVFAAERSLELMKPNVITDRTIYDVCAFTLGSKSMEDFEKKLFFEMAILLRKEYDVVIYVSPEGVEIEDNGVRTIDAEYRMKIDRAIKMMVEGEYAPVKLIKVAGSTEERIKTILDNLN